MTALRPERDSGAAYGESFADSYGDTGDQGSSYGQQPYEGSGALGEWYGGESYVTQAQQAAEARSAAGYGGDGYGYEGYAAQGYRDQAPSATQEPYAEPYMPPPDDETVALRVPDPPPSREPISPSPASSAASASSTPTGGRAARRKAAKGRHGRHGGTRQASDAAEADSESLVLRSPAWRHVGRPGRASPVRPRSPAGRSVRCSSRPAC